jgi:Glycine zipper
MRFAVLAVLAAVPALAGQDPAPSPQTAPAQAAAPAPQAAPKPATLGLFVYPNSGQEAAQQGQDENECYGWARQQTGIDPTAPPTQAETPDAPRGGAVKGAAAGAAGGAAIGAIAGDTGDGAAIGAVAGAARGRRAQKKAKKQAEAQAKQAAQSQDAQKKETFKKAWGACLEGRGYSVK